MRGRLPAGQGGGALWREGAAGVVDRGGGVEGGDGTGLAGR